MLDLSQDWAFEVSEIAGVHPGATEGAHYRGEAFDVRRLYEPDSGQWLSALSHPRRIEFMEACLQLGATTVEVRNEAGAPVGEPHIHVEFGGRKAKH